MRRNATSASPVGRRPEGACGTSSRPSPTSPPPGNPRRQVPRTRPPGNQGIARLQGRRHHRRHLGPGAAGRREGGRQQLLHQPRLPNLPAAGAEPPATGPVETTGGGGRVGLLLISPFVEPGTTSETYFNHFSLLVDDRGTLRARTDRLRRRTGHHRLRRIDLQRRGITRAKFQGRGPRRGRRSCPCFISDMSGRLAPTAVKGLVVAALRCGPPGIRLGACPGGSPGCRPQPALVYHLEVTLLMFYGFLLLITPVHSALAWGSLPTETPPEEPPSPKERIDPWTRSKQQLSFWRKGQQSAHRGTPKRPARNEATREQ